MRRTSAQARLGQPLTGVFSTCSPNRPNPIGLHRARIVARDGLRIEVDALEAIDGTPVVDVKPAIGPPRVTRCTRRSSPFRAAPSVESLRLGGENAVAYDAGFPCTAVGCSYRAGRLIPESSPAPWLT